MMGKRCENCRSIYASCGTTSPCVYTKRRRERAQRNMACIDCTTPITYEPGQNSRKRCAECKRIHDRKLNREDVRRYQVKQWTTRMTKTANRIGPT